MNKTKKIAVTKQVRDMQNGALKAYENAYRRYALKGCIDDTYEWSAMVNIKYMCIHILHIAEECCDIIDMKVDNELRNKEKA